MSVSYPISMPTTIGIAEVTFSMVNAEATSASPFTGVVQHFKWPDQHWEADITLPPLNREDARDWISFLARLKGGTSSQFPSFLLYNPDYIQGGTQSGNFAATSVANPNEISLSGLDSSESQCLRAGDFIRLGASGSSRLHMIIEDVASDSGGNATANIWPSNIQTLSNQTAYSNPSQVYGAFIMVDKNPSFNINNISQYGINFRVRGLR